MDSKEYMVPLTLAYLAGLKQNGGHPNEAAPLAIYKIYQVNFFREDYMNGITSNIVISIIFQLKNTTVHETAC